MIHWKRLGSLLVCSCCFLGTFVSVSAVKPDELNTLDQAVAQDILTTSPKLSTTIDTFSIKDSTRKLFDFESYQNLGIVIGVDEFANIYESASTESTVVGKLSLNGGCTILGTEGEFTQVQSGEVKGYIPSQYLATDTNALLVALEVTYELADVKEDTTIYSDQDAESTPLMETTAGSRFLVTEKTLDWIKVQTEEDTYGYIPADKVSIIPELKMAEKVEQSEPTQESTRVVVSAGSIDSNYRYGGYSDGTEDLRSQIVNYALSFVGNPYVWGGTNPYTGADCSGFVQYVYAQYGYSIPRTTYAQWDWAVANGKVIPPEMAQAGDLVLYDGHVAMLTGNGNEIVHASNSAPYPQGGIKITSDYEYRSILGIVRVI